MPRRPSGSVFLPWESMAVHVLTITSAVCIVLSACYLIWQLSGWMVIGSLALAVILGWLFRPPSVRSKRSTNEREASNLLLPMVGLVCDIAVLVFLMIGRTDAAIASPWQAVSAVAFLFYGVATGCLICSLKRLPFGWSLPLLTLHAVATWSVSLIIYQLGFGYDPFVHQATEAHILAHGVIFPKTPFYIGQYVIVVSLAWLTHLPIAWIDRLLVPILAIIAIPPAAFIALRRGWLNGAKHVPVALAALFILPTGYFGFTAPFNLALIDFLLMVLFLPLVEHKRSKVLLCALAVAALVIHPLMGIPALALLVGVFLSHRERLAAWTVFTIIPLGLYTAFSIYLSTHHGTPSLPTMEILRQSFFAVFGNPYELYLGSWALATYYALLYASPILFIGLGIYGYSLAVARRPSLKSSVRILFGAAGGLILSAIILPAFFTIPNIIGMEQFEFALRLITILPLLFLPGIAVALHAWLAHPSVSRIRYVVSAVIIGLISAGAWYAAYPQYNDIAYFPAPGLSRSDVDAVTFIDHDAGGASYAVLSHQMMGAAALQRFGFDHGVPTTVGDRYFYAIPTGGEFYTLYVRLLSEENPGAVRDEIFNLIKTDHIYVAVPDSWDHFGDVDRRLQSVSSKRVRIGGIDIYQLKTAGRE